MASSTRELNIRLIATISVVGVILLGSITMAVKAWFAWEQNRAQNNKLINATNTQLHQTRVANARAWVDQPKTLEQDGTTYRKVPIEDAMKMVVEQAERTAPATQPDNGGA